LTPYGGFQSKPGHAAPDSLQIAVQRPTVDSGARSTSDQLKIARGEAFPLVDRPMGGPPQCEEPPITPSGRQDLNLRPLDPQSSALPSCATSRPPPAGARSAYRIANPPRPAG